MPDHRPRSWVNRALFAAVLNTLIALAITAIHAHPFGENLLYAQLIGMGIWAGIEVGRRVLRARGWLGLGSMAALVVVVAVFAGYGFGMASGNLLLGRPALNALSGLPRSTVGFLLMSLAVGVFGTYFFTSRELLARARFDQQEAQRQASEARLRLLESQLEPHMLFNTLANLRALIATDPPRAIQMLDRLNAFLRATLAASRTEARGGQHTLREEFARLDDYLALMGVRMGPRLQARLELPEALAEHRVPALLLQPLVENAIRHGLEPSARGGTLSVTAREAEGALLLSVIDDGAGSEATPLEGFGLTQVRERLQTLHGDAARFEWRSTPGQGTRAELVLPITPEARS
jgi:signal transduction histidine kinase